MTLKLTLGLWLWAGTLVLGLLAVIPFSPWVRAMAVLTVVVCVAAAWTRAGRRATQPCEMFALADGISLPATAYRQPVVLVCGDGLDALFGEVAVEQLALRTTAQGCYVRVPDLEQLPALTASLQSLRPDWGGQLSVMFIVNPDEHTDGAELAGRLQSFCYQLGRARKRGVALPLMLVSYLHGSRSAAAGSAAPWFSWEAGHASPGVLEASGCVSVGDWQRQATNGAMQTARLHASVQLNSIVHWLDEKVLPHFSPPDALSGVGLPLVCAITLVPELPRSVNDNLWQQWLRGKVALAGKSQDPAGAGALLSFPDPLLPLLPVHPNCSPARRASVAAVWMFALAGLIAMASSAWQNDLLLRQVSDDLRRYAAIPEPTHHNQPEVAQREEAVAVLRQDAARLNSYYRNGEPLSLGLGLYRGERFRAPVLAVVSSHRQPAAVPTQPGVSSPVRLDSLSLFSTGSAELKADSTKVLINALVDIKAQPGWLIVIAGHTDITGSAEQNLQLSRARAAAVRDWMQRMGDIPDSCFAVQGFGANQPVASNDTESGRSANRRVDIRLVPEVGACVPLTAGPDRQPLSQLATVNN